MPQAQQQPGDGIARPVIPLQNTEEAFEIVEDDAARQISPDRVDFHPTDNERAGSYEYVPEDEDQNQQGTQADQRTGNVQQAQEGQQADDQGGTEEELSARQRRRRREAANRERERQELIRLRAENAQLKQGHQQLDTRLANVEQAGIDGQISELESEIARANAVIKTAISQGDGESVTQAMDIRDAFRDRLGKLKAQKEQTTTQRQTTQQQQNPNPAMQVDEFGLTQAQKSFGRIFIGRHPWFNPNPNVRHADSDAVRQLDNELLAEGRNPSTPEYWVELERRIEEDMPHIKQQAANDGGGGGNQGGGRPNQQNGGRGNGGGGRPAGGPKLPGQGAGGSGAAGGGPIKFHLSAARKQAMIDRGIWGDKEAMDRQIKYYMKWDKENPSK